MNANAKETVVVGGIAMVMLGLAASFALDLWAKPNARAHIPPTPPEFTNNATVRISAAELFRTDGDTSGLMCNSCHDEGKAVEVKRDAKGAIVLSEPHKDIVLNHGRDPRSNNCLNCHNPKNLEQLIGRDGHIFKLTEGTQHCGTCHGPTYRDWDKGLHGRDNGFWDPRLGEKVRQDCTACHDPHAPAFPSMKAAPAPYRHSSPGATNALTTRKH